MNQDRMAFQNCLLIPIALSLGITAGDLLADEPHKRSDRIIVHQTGPRLELRWPVDDREHGLLVLDTGNEGPLVSQLGLAASATADPVILARDIDPEWLLTVGSRQGLRSPGWVVFFDRVWQRPFKTHRGQLKINKVSLVETPGSTRVILHEITAGGFRGRVEITVYAGSRLVQMEAVVSTPEDRRAILYDAGLVSQTPGWSGLAWMSTGGTLQKARVTAGSPAVAQAVRHRTIMAETPHGTIAVFPPPHQFFYPLDQSNNLKFTWYGSKFRGLTRGTGLGVRQHFQGDRRFVPWFNAPPRTEQRLGFFCLLSRQDPSETLDEVLRYTHRDGFSALPGHHTFSSHYHFAHTADVLERRARGLDATDTPEFATILREMGVNILHLAEFHGDGHARDTGDIRLNELHVMHQECRRLSSKDFLLLPGEEPNVHFGGHWIDFFPRPVYWIMRRKPDEPFVADHPRYGRVYRVGNSDEMLELLKRERGLAWTAHPRIKGSHGFPDKYRQSRFYQSDRFLGAAWKAMPADLSRPRLGWRVLDLLDDMNNWGARKFTPGEVDVFKIDSTHELYGHMNVNYLRLDAVPRFGNGWQPVLEALRGGRFFVSTGEVLIPRFAIAGRQSGETVRGKPETADSVEISLRWTFPLKRVELVWSDGQRVQRTPVPGFPATPFGTRTIRTRLPSTTCRWVRLEAWDVAVNGAFTMPVWIDSP